MHKKRFSNADRQKTDFTFLIYTPKYIHLKKNTLFFNADLQKNSHYFYNSKIRCDRQK